MAKKKRKKNKVPYYIASAMTVLAAASVGILIYSGGLNPSVKPTEPTTVIEQADTVKSAQQFVKRTAVEYPLMATDADGVFLCANPYGLFEFYEMKGGALSPCADTQTMDIKVTCSHQEIPAKLHYIEREGRVTGYGLFLTTLYEDDVRLYDYAFFRLTEMPESYGTGKMLLVDFDESDFAKADKTYTEVFSFDMATGKSTRMTSDNGRTVDNLGRLRTDWAQMNEALLQLGGNKLYLSGRNYQLDSDTADLIRNNDTSNTKPTWVSSGIWEQWMHTENGTLYYAKETESGFEVYGMNSKGEEKKLAAYAGSVDDYLFSGDYMLEKNTLALKRISTNENKGVLKSDAIHVLPTDFAVSADGTKAAVLFDGETQSALLCDLTAGKSECVQDKGLFANSCDRLRFLPDGKLLTIAETASGYEALVWTF